MSHSPDASSHPTKPRPARLRKRLIPFGIAGSVVLAGLGANTAFASPSANALISEVYGGGGNSGATYTNDFIELANGGSGAFDLSGYTVQYLSGSPSAASKWQVTALTGSIGAGGHYLVGESKGTGGSTSLPTPDASGSIAMSGTAGTVALVSGSDPLTCVNAADCAADPRIHDLVGYGTATVHEGSGAAAGASNSESVARTSLTDTDDNAADFAAGDPTPTNSAGTSGGSGTGGGGSTPPVQPVAAKIHDIQGDTRISPLNGKPVTDVTGIVIGVRSEGSRGFWIQDPNPDADPATSEGIFVFTNAAPTVSVGDSVSVSGTVAEYYPAGTSAGAQSITEINSPKVTTLSTGNALPAPVVLSKKNVPDAWAPDAGGGNIEGLTLKPGTYALDLYESLEGMNVEVSNARVVAPTDAFDELWVTDNPNQNKTARGGTYYPSYNDPDSGRLMVTSLSSDAFPEANVDDTLTGNTVGPLDYSQFAGTYALAARTMGSLTSGGLQPEITDPALDREATVATYNVENLSPADPQSKFDELAKGLVTNLRGPDIVALEEIQDNNGPTDDGTVSADQTLKQLTDAIVAAGGPQYDWREIDPQNDKDGGEPGGNIRNVFLFNPARVSFDDIPGGSATSAVGVTGTGADTNLTASPGRISPNDPSWNSSRKPLVGEFTFQGQKLFVIANHFVSKLGDQDVDSRFQLPNLGSETGRVAQATVENTFIKQLEAADPKADVVAVGDLNDYQFSPALHTLTSNGAVLTDLVNTLPEREQYSYVYEGDSEDLDHILVSPNVTHARYDVVHINSEFAHQTSDHDPQVVRIKP